MLERLERIFVAANRWLLILLMAAMSIIVFANVCLRYLTNDSIVWAEEVARHMMIWMTFLGSGLVLRFGGHVAIDNLHAMIGGKAGRILRTLICLLLIAFFCSMIWKGWGYVMAMRFQTTPATGIPFAYIYAAIPVGFLFMLIHLLLVMRAYVRANRFAEDGEVDAEAAASI